MRTVLDKSHCIISTPQFLPAMVCHFVKACSAVYYLSVVAIMCAGECKAPGPTTSKSYAPQRQLNYLSKSIRTDGYRPYRVKQRPLLDPLHPGPRNAGHASDYPTSVYITKRCRSIMAMQLSLFMDYKLYMNTDICHHHNPWAQRLLESNVPSLPH